MSQEIPQSRRSPAPVPAAPAGRPAAELELIGSALIAEYEVLREEIGRYQDHQKQIMNFAFMVSAAMIALAQPLFSDTGPKGDDVRSILLYFSPLFAMLAGLYSDRTIRILRLAGYINNHLRRKLSSLVSMHLWQWEVYKTSRVRGGHPFAYALDKIRWLVFILPGAGSVGLYFWLGGNLSGARSWFGLGVSALGLAAAVLIMFLAEETKGVATLDETDLDTLDHSLVRAPSRAE
ncbi:hypothetical protein ACFWNR_15700 [Streptomyces virginiae]|uniref:hypothetical protein n=1 Tax=Streptomyces TaxID=1883 RepID=UPI00136B7E09|nr:hypothetical protein [Streptomyces sp. SID1046]MYV75605.1 hypothetical protein [Streptomyces sp. SID1046]